MKQNNEHMNKRINKWRKSDTKRKQMLVNCCMIGEIQSNPLKTGALPVICEPWRHDNTKKKSNIRVCWFSRSWCGAQPRAKHSYPHSPKLRVSISIEYSIGP